MSALTRLGEGFHHVLMNLAKRRARISESASSRVGALPHGWLTLHHSGEELVHGLFVVVAVTNRKRLRQGATIASRVGEQVRQQFVDEMRDPTARQAYLR
ncbi:unnamed protein product [Prorocentrum cordatum]|uniref:DNA-directed RNA polymerase n=1 Tax=Prorocentrum cordatum TaxID=2364126 RepID=A0ABN9YBK9_9DINO|nr:unnamed protein product [Polarella glacialis]